MRRLSITGVLVLLLTMCLSPRAIAKEIRVPQKQVKENKFGNGGKFSMDYKAESENFVLFWEKSFGRSPEKYGNASRRFYPEEILREAERFYTCYTDRLKFADRKTSHAAKYKMIIWMFNDDESTAYGWGDEGVGMMWMRPCRTNTYPYCALAHEMGHSFQYLTEADGGRGFAGCPLVEFTSQWMLWQVYPDWITIEKFHLDAYMKQTHLSLLNEANMYHAPQILEYWSYKRGEDIIARIWKEGIGKEDPASVYKRLTGTDQEEFNAEIYDAATRFVTWDIPRIKETCSSYANEHSCKLEKTTDGWYRITKERCPQDYGYNAIRMNVPEAGKTVKLKFEGLAGEEGFRSGNLQDAGWRYGFLAATTDGKRIYGKMNKARNGSNGTVNFTVPPRTQFLWLVVTAAPSVHRGTWKTWGELSKEKGKEAQWPYRIQVEGTTIHREVTR